VKNNEQKLKNKVRAQGEMMCSDDGYLVLIGGFVD